MVALCGCLEPVAVFTDELDAAREPADARAEAKDDGGAPADVGVASDGGHEQADAGADAGSDSGVDAGTASDAGGAVADGGIDGGADAGAPPFIPAYCSDANLSFDKFCDCYFRIRAQRLAGCYGRDPQTWHAVSGFALLYGTEAPLQLTYCPAVARSIAGGRATYDATKAAACLQTVGSTIPCDQLFHRRFTLPDSTCSGVLTGAVPLGGTCSRQHQCVTGTWCKFASAGCGGTCTATVPAGQSCLSISVEEYLYICGSNAGCVDGTCRTFGAEGDPCWGPSHGFCVPGLWCLGVTTAFASASTAGVCRAPLDDGQSCTRDSECLSFMCRGTPATCQPRKKAGDACVRFSSLWPEGECEGYMACVAGRCTAWPRAGETLVGTSQDDSFGCFESSPSRGAVTCAAWAKLGEACPTSTGGTCAVPYSCVNGRCAERCP